MARASKLLIGVAVTLCLVLCRDSATYGRDAVDVALSQIGKPYEWGQAGPDSFDCSGLVRFSYSQVGIALNNSRGGSGSENLVSATTRIGGSSALPELISSGVLRRGDLLFFSIARNGVVDHVGLYIGGTTMVHAPTEGEVVKQTNTLSGSYWSSRFQYAQRVLTDRTMNGEIHTTSYTLQTCPDRRLPDGCTQTVSIDGSLKITLPLSIAPVLDVTGTAVLDYDASDLVAVCNPIERDPQSKEHTRRTTSVSGTALSFGYELIEHSDFYGFVHRIETYVFRGSLLGETIVGATSKDVLNVDDPLKDPRGRGCKATEHWATAIVLR